ncbi:MAG: hypothetical protein H8E66_07985 [Planctomycetes bacterium]|nr:hypothetical protein [Planctomycetota bacterium]
MKNFVSHLFKCTLGFSLVVVSVVTAVTATAPSVAVAQDAQKPAVVISLASIEQLMGNVGYLTQVAGSPEVGAIITIMSGQYIEGLNTKQPAGGYVTFAPQPSAVVFLPVSDFDMVTTKIEEMVGELEDVGDGVKKLALQREIFLKEKDGWIFASDQRANLDNVPADPKLMLEGLYETYDVAIRANVQSVPAELRQMFLSEIKEGFERTVASEDDDDKRRAQQEVGGRVIGRIGRFADEADQLTVGWGTSSNEGKTFIDFSATALAGTNLAKEIESAVTIKSEFAGFLVPGAAATVHFTAPVLKEDVEKTVLMLNAAREKALEEIDKDDDLPNDEARAAAKDIVGSLMDVLQQTIEAGKLNGGATLLLEPQNINFVAGGFIADGKSVEKDLKRLVKLAKQAKDNPGVEVKFDAETHGGVSLHTIVVPIPQREEEARKILGDKMITVVGTGAKSVYFAFGTDSVELLKQVIDGSAAAKGETSPMTVNIALGPILNFAASIDDDPVVAGLAEAMKNGQGKDQIAISSKGIPRGIAYRVEVEEDVLQLIGQAAKMRGAQDRDPF